MLRKKLKKRKSSVEGGSLLESLTAQFGKSGHVKKVPTIKSEDISATNIEKEILEDGREAEVIQQQHTYQISAINKFSINKEGITRAVTKFYRLPSKQPRTVCLHFPSIGLQHKHILTLVRSVLHGQQDAKIESIQFVDRNVRHATRGLENRWLIRMSTDEDFRHLLKSSIIIFSRKLVLRSYDEVIYEELKDFQDYVRNQTSMFLGSKMSTNKDKMKDMEAIDEQQMELRQMQKEEADKAEKERKRLLAILAGEIDPDIIEEVEPPPKEDKQIHETTNEEQEHNDEDDQLSDQQNRRSSTGKDKRRNSEKNRKRSSLRPEDFPEKASENSIKTVVESI